MSANPSSIEFHDRGRRRFIGGLAAGWVVTGLSAGIKPTSHPDFRKDAESLLKDWCDGLIRLQWRDPGKPGQYGAFKCPACGRIHGRCGEAFLPLLSMAAVSGKGHYLDAALAAAAWMKNVDSPDGSWTNETDPASWKGTTVFSMTALAEALEWHGDLLDGKFKSAMRQRLKRAGDYVLTHFSTDYGNINYAAAGAHGLSLLGRLLGEPSFTRRGRELAHQTLAFFTTKDRFLYGEGHPTGKRSAKGCYPVDLGYNVAESLPSLVHHALLENDKEVLDAAVSSLRTHLEFMLPDGAWDNSWGTRSYKWTCWGSRTADGCQSAFIRLSSIDPVFATAAWRNLEMLRACTGDGLLHGGPHYVDHGVPPCVHHTFTQAKAIAGALRYAGTVSDALPALPRAVATGVRHFPEIDSRLVASGPWRATVSGYDWFYRPGLYQVTGGSIGMLWHERLGPLLAGGLAEYLPVEEHNMQPVPDREDVPSACRVETGTPDSGWFTNLHDGTAVIRHESDKDFVRVFVETRLVSSLGKDPSSGPLRFRIEYRFRAGSFTIVAQPLDSSEARWSLVVPVISRKSEPLEKVSASCWKITKPDGTLRVSSNQPVVRMPARGERAFNLVPGFQFIPFRIAGSGMESVEFNLTSDS